MADWIEGLNKFLTSAKWNSNLALIIQDYLNHTEYTSTTVDSLLMGITKQVETTLKEGVEQFTAATVPGNCTNSVELLNYAKKKGFIPEPRRGSDALYSLIYWFFEKPRNTAHHVFTDFPLPTHMMFISTANYIMNEVERLNKERNYYGAKTNFDYNATSRALYISVADIRKDDQIITPPRLEANLVGPDKSVSRYPIENTGGYWALRISTQGCGSGTYSVNLVGYTAEGAKFNISGSAIVVV